LKLFKNLLWQAIISTIQKTIQPESWMVFSVLNRLKLSQTVLLVELVKPFNTNVLVALCAYIVPEMVS